MDNRPSSSPRVVIVTGASRGLGRAIALGFGQAGDRVLVNYRTEASEADQTVRAIAEAGGVAIAYQADVRDSRAVAAMVAAAMNRWGRVDVLVCNAGVTAGGLALRLSDDAWERVVSTILTGTFHCLRHTGPVMQAQQSGAVIFLGSLAGSQGCSGEAPYAAAKAGLLGLMRSVAREWGAIPVRVNMILPGWHATALTEFQNDPSRPPFAPVLGHGATMESVATFVVALAALPHVSGQVFTLDSRIAPS